MSHDYLLRFTPPVSVQTVVFAEPVRQQLAASERNRQPCNIFRVKVGLATGKRFAYTGLFASSQEAIDQTQADYPGANSVSAMCVRRPA